MANSLLDFVMSLVRDPAVAARYADDPGQAIAEANLAGVTSADVSALIPVVSESLSTAVPVTGIDGVIGDVAGNVWASGAATAAFDAFDDLGPDQLLDGVPTVVTDQVDVPDRSLNEGFDLLDDAGVPDLAGADDLLLQFDGPIIDDVPLADVDDDIGWAEPLVDIPQSDADSSGFDVF